MFVLRLYLATKYPLLKLLTYRQTTITDHHKQRPNDDDLQTPQTPPSPLQSCSVQTPPWTIEQHVLQLTAQTSSGLCVVLTLHL
ncbi:early protein E4 [human papillomavirus 33]|uniref:Protein E4 n=1 Tax=Human papillomavirus 33 TaxID=10586 RepID=F8S3X0_HPV33|nr:early protein E4 [human papillomavirus 33]AEI61106.1 early protein E4 [human papillomavirus 33]AEI61114.1 early protein E4 [human papillomavirus 33]AEI61122.1 early protein E4 [human papillomavirus 33]AEI61130.1 early protein E4 [human papillomavirus 33]